MKKFLKSLVIALVLMTMSVSFVSAENTEKSTMTVLGAKNFYPIEYYDARSDRYCGVIPLILEKITEKTGIKFKYIYMPDGDYDDIIEKTKADVVSGYIIGSKENYAADRVKIFSYNRVGQTINVGIAFTNFADKEKIEEIKAEIAKISENEINGYLVEVGRNTKDEKPVVLFWVLGVLVLISVVAFLGAKQKRTSVLINKSKFTDAETGIGNLALFEHNFNAIPASERNAYYIAYIIIDTNFLLLNSENAVFENMTKYAGHVIESAAGKDGFAARITESGFALVFRAENDEDAKKHIKNLVSVLNISKKDPYEGNTYGIKAAVYNLHADDHNSEVVIYNLRRNCNSLFDGEEGIVFCDVNAMNSEIEEKKLTGDFADAFKNREFRLYLQFIVDNKTKKIVSAEALSRWEHSEKGCLLPGAYIKSMETIGMIKELDFYMFEMVCRQLHKWHETEMGHLSISCNFTRRTLSEENFVEKIEKITEKYIFDKSRLIMEITEDTMEKNTSRAMENVRRCKEMGIRVALDDLGSGYTSLSNLCDYPIDVVKIDRNILLKAEQNRGKELFSGMVAFAHNLNKKVVCEGVETDEQNDFVTASECDYIQGWYYGKAIPVEQCEEFFKEYTNRE